LIDRPFSIDLIPRKDHHAADRVSDSPERLVL
jgi:hypothetical protein